ncbi:membrane protein insertase YidC [Marinicella sp. W31]|uniref:membrane protein insertase YidC n=1 Tax=Marinicella sp. W31 TaxID=3023713 RepID=UPI003756F327
MSNSKNLLLITLLFLGFLLYTNWQKDYGPQPENNTAAETQNSANTPQINDSPAVNNQASQPVTDDVPAVSNNVSPSVDTPQIQTAASVNIIAEVETNLLKLAFAEKGAMLVYAELKNYPLEKGSEQNVVLMDYRNNQYFAQSGLAGGNGFSFDHNLSFSAANVPTTVTAQSTELVFTANHNGTTVTKTYVVNADTYEMQIKQQVTNNSQETWTLSEYHQLKRNNPWLGNEPGFNDAGRMSFKGAGYFDSEEGYEKRDFEEIQEESLDLSIPQEGWIAMVQHYFISAVVPNKNNIRVQTVYQNSPTPYLVRSVSPAQQVQPNSSAEFVSDFYVGPKIQKDLPNIAKGLELTVDYGIFTVFAKPLFWVLEKIHGFVGNWGWSIVLLTILIKLVFFKLSEKQYRSMAKMRKLQPRIKTLKERYKDNRQKFNEEMMKMYQQEKVNPLGGCLPILIQIPVFIALYWVLLESVELRQAPFMLWLQDLSSPDPYFILPAINAAAMYMTQKLSPTPGMDPMQEKILKFMPLAFSVLFAFFQSGLVLYWAVNSVLSLAQQWVITRRIDQQAS